MGYKTPNVDGHAGQMRLVETELALLTLASLSLDAHWCRENAGKQLLIGEENTMPFGRPMSTRSSKEESGRREGLLE